MLQHSNTLTEVLIDKFLCNDVKQIHPWPSQLSPEIFDPRKMDTNFFEANFEYFEIPTARNGEINKIVKTLFLSLE